MYANTCKNGIDSYCAPYCTVSIIQKADQFLLTRN